MPVVPRAGLDPSFLPPAGATCLSEASRTYLLHGIVYRPHAPWTPTVHALLRHLHDVGYRGSPRLVGAGIDTAGRQQIGYIDGELVHPYAWSNRGIIEVARLLRELHDATASFVSPRDAVWMPWYTHRPKADPVIGHGDVGPWNIIAGEGVPVAFIDWDFAGPVDRLDEVAEAVRLNCQLHGEDVTNLRHLAEPAVRAQQVALFADSYGLDTAQRDQLLPRMVECALRGCANDCDEAVVTPDFTGPHPMVWGMAWQIRGARWLLDHSDILADALGARR
jgi:hypothetical protein